MKELMIGNKAVARGMYEAGVAVVSSYPGTPSTEITEEAVKYDEIYCEWAPNEKVALEAAHGASLAGKRSACCMKHVGLNVAADPLFSISYIGLDAGLVICVADDPGMHSSQNEQDSRHYAIAAKVPMLEPSDSEESRVFTKQAFEISEKFHTPVFIKMCMRVCHSQSIVNPEPRIEREPIPYVKDQSRVMLPAQARKAHIKVEQRTKDLIDFAETSTLNRIDEGSDKSIGFITSSTSYQYVKEVFGDKHPVLKIGMINPMPEKKIVDFASSVERLVVVEELDPIIENHCKILGLKVEGKNLFPMVGEFSQAVVRKAMGLEEKKSLAIEDAIPPRPPVMCAGCPHRGLFYVLSKNKCNVYGDIGCYTLGSFAPLNAMDLNVCMGASLSGIHGFNKARGEEYSHKMVGVIGDSTFVHSGMTGLADIVYNNSASTVIILDNSITGMTGHQQNPTTGYNIKGDPAAKINLEALCHAMGVNRVRVVDPYNLDETDKAVKEELAANEPSVIITRRPCALLKSVKKLPPLKVNAEKCTGCKSCMKIGCPAISVRPLEQGAKKSLAHIDSTQCVGCSVCEQMCKFGALEK